MPRAAPGVNARGALRRIIPGEPSIPVRDVGRHKEEYFSRSGNIFRIRPDVRRFQNSKYFTLHLSGFEVERGCLGEVESLVGDCRPPPPGNPRQPTILCSTNMRNGGLVKNPFSSHGFITFIPKWQKNGGEFLPMCKYHTFKITKYSANLKYLNQLQYFKNKYSYFSCAEQSTVLEFVNSHYHLYGFRLVGPPPIAITNVLIT